MDADAEAAAAALPEGGGRRYPVLLIPGVCCSQMRATDQRTGRSEVAWFSPKVLPVPKMGAQFSKYIWGRPDPKTGRFVSHIDKYARVEPIQGFAGCDALLNHWILETIVFFRPSFRYGLYYRTFRQRLERLGYRVGQDLMVYTYDWRQSMCDPALLEEMHRLVTLMRERSGGLKVNVVAHSLGGMLVQAYMRHYPDWSDDIRRFVGLGIPYDGASANALSAYYNGFALGLPLIRRVVAKGLQATSTNTMYLCNAPRQLSRVTSCMFYKRWIGQSDAGGGDAAPEAGQGTPKGSQRSLWGQKSQKSLKSLRDQKAQRSQQCLKTAKDPASAAGTPDGPRSPGEGAEPSGEGKHTGSGSESLPFSLGLPSASTPGAGSTFGPTPDPTQPSTKSGEDSPLERSRRCSEGSEGAAVRETAADGCPEGKLSRRASKASSRLSSRRASREEAPQQSPLSPYSCVDAPAASLSLGPPESIVEECSASPAAETVEAVETAEAAGATLASRPASPGADPKAEALAERPPVLVVDCSRYRSCPSLPAVLVERINETPGLVAPEHLRDAFQRLVPGIKSSAIRKRSKDIRKRNVGSRDMDRLMHPDVKAHLPTAEELRSGAQGPRARDPRALQTPKVSKARLRRQAAQVRRNERRMTRLEKRERRKEVSGLSRSEREARRSAQDLAGVGAPLERVGSLQASACPRQDPRAKPAEKVLGFWRWEAVSMWPETSFKGFTVSKDVSRKFTASFSHPWFELVGGRLVLREDCPRREIVLQKKFPGPCSYWEFPDMLLIAEAIEILCQQEVEEIPKRLAASGSCSGRKRPKLVKPPRGLAEELCSEPRPWNCLAQAEAVAERSVYSTLESAYPKKSLDALLFEPHLPCWTETLEERSRPIYPPKPGSGFRYLGVIGSGNRTPIHVVYPKPVSRVRDVMDQEPISIWGDGDGTVLTNSAMADGFTDEFLLDRVVVTGPIHYFLVHDDAVWEHIWKALQ